MIDLPEIARGWELAGRVIVMAGLAGLLGLGGRLVTLWLRKRNNDRAPKRSARGKP